MGMRVTKESQKNFDNLLDEMQTFTRAERSKITLNGARDVAFALLAATPAAPAGTRNRGFAKQAYVWVLRTLGKAPSANFPGASDKSKSMQRVIASEAPDRTGYIIENTVPFIEDLDQGTVNNLPANINEIAITRASAQMGERLQRMAQKYAQKWRR